jgi:hypothetical protein
MRRTAKRSIGGLVLVWAFACAGAANAQDAAVPDFSGLWERSADPGGRDFQPPESGPGPILREAGAGAFRIGDYTNPILQPHAAEAVKAHGDIGRAGTVVNPAWSYCEPSGVPLILNLADPIQILQDTDYVVIMNRGDSQVRRVSMNAGIPDDVRPSWYGYSVGHYEDGALVIETVGLNDRTLVDRYGSPSSESLRVVERYTMNEDRSLIRVDFTVEDPSVFTTPWSAYVTYRPATEPFVEQICAENNFIPGDSTFQIPEESTPDF